MVIQELIKKSQKIDIDLDPQSQTRDIADALLLFSLLSRLGKNVSFSGTQTLPPSFAWVDIPTLSAKTTVVTIREVAPFISKISYEKNEHDLKFSLTLKEDMMSLERIALEKKPQGDLLFIVGDNASQDNQNDIIINPHPRIWNLRKAFEAGLQLLSPFHIPQLRLLQRTLLTLEYLPTKKLCMVPLERKDFKETQTNTKDVRALAEELTRWGGFYSSYLTLFQSLSVSGKIQGLLWTNQRELRDRISAAFGATQKGNWVLFSSQDNTLWKTKEKILSAL